MRKIFKQSIVIAMLAALLLCGCAPASQNIAQDIQNDTIITSDGEQKLDAADTSTSGTDVTDTDTSTADTSDADVADTDTPEVDSSASADTPKVDSSASAVAPKPDFKPTPLRKKKSICPLAWW